MHNVGFHKATRGILPVNYAFGFVQTDRYLKSCPNKNIRLKPEYIEQAEQILEPYGGRKKIFVHIRHGDYPDDMRLPDGFYRSAFDRLCRENGIADNECGAVAVLLGDDPDFASSQFADLPCVYVSRNSLITDFALMTLCDGGVISNSTFAWTGAWFCKNTLPVYAPKYWTSFRKKEWYPRDIATDRFVWIDVEY